MRHVVVKLADFDPEPMIDYAITERDLTSIYQYLQAMQHILPKAHGKRFAKPDTMELVRSYMKR